MSAFILLVTDLMMSDAELQASKNGASDCSSVEPPSRPQRSRKINYHLLNGGSDGEVDLEDYIIKKPRMGPPPNRSESVGPEDSASQLRPDLPTPSESLPQGSSTRSLSEALQPFKSHNKSRTKPLNQWLWSQSNASPLPGKLWRPK